VRKQSIFNDKIERAIKKLPDSDVGNAIYQSLQTILLKGNNYTEEEKAVYGHFLHLLHVAQENPIHGAFKENHIDACHEFLQAKISKLESRSPRNGKPFCSTAESPNGKRFKFAQPAYQPPKIDDFYQTNIKKDDSD